MLRRGLLQSLKCSLVLHPQCTIGAGSEARFRETFHQSRLAELERLGVFSEGYEGVSVGASRREHHPTPQCPASLAQKVVATS